MWQSCADSCLYNYFIGPDEPRCICTYVCAYTYVRSQIKPWTFTIINANVATELIYFLIRKDSHKPLHDTYNTFYINALWSTYYMYVDIYIEFKFAHTIFILKDSRMVSPPWNTLLCGSVEIWLDKIKLSTLCLCMYRIHDTQR